MTDVLSRDPPDAFADDALPPLSYCVYCEDLIPAVAQRPVEGFDDVYEMVCAEHAFADPAPPPGEEPDDAPVHTGAMVALVPADPGALVVEGGDPEEQIHLTLRYLGEAAALDDAVRAEILQAVQSVSGMGPPIDVVASGLVIMGEDDAGNPAVALLMQSDEVVTVKDIVDDWLHELAIPEETYPCFIPHITLGYGLDPTDPSIVAMSTSQAVTFDRLLVTFADERNEFPLAPTPGASAMPSTMTVKKSDELAADEAAAGDPAGQVTAQLDGLPVVFASFTYADDAAATAIADAVATVPTFDLSAAVPGDGTAVLSGSGLTDLRNAIRGSAPDATWDGADDSLTITLDAASTLADGDTVSVDSVTLETETGTQDIPLVTVAAPTGGAAAAAEGAPTAAPAAGPIPEMSTDPAAFRALLIPEGVESGDGRLIKQGATTWREPPLPFMVMFANPEGGEGHDGAEICARIDSVFRDGNDIYADGVYDLSIDAGTKAMAMRDGGQIVGVSVDLDMVTIEFENELPDDSTLDDLFNFDPGLMIVTAGRVMGATQCPFPAFADSKLLTPSPEAIAAAGGKLDVLTIWTPVMLEGGVLVASAGRRRDYPVHPPLAWLERPSLTDGDYQALRSDPNCTVVTPEGRFLCYLGTWDSCHIGFDGRCVNVPRSSSGYRGFRSGTVLSAEGTSVATGVITLDTVHPDLAMSASDACAFYAHSGSGVADVAPYEDDMGVLLVGALRPDVTDAQVRVLRASRVSGDWRRFQNAPRELVAVLVVNVAGFRSMAPALVASGAFEDAGDRPRRPGTFAYRLVDNEVEALVAAGSAPSPLIQRLAALEKRVDELSRSTRPIRAEHAIRRWHEAG